MSHRSLYLRALVAAVTALLFSTPVFTANTNDQCLMCHSAHDLNKKGKDGKSVSLHVKSDEFAASAHGQLGCTDCHADLAGQSFPHKDSLEPVKCGGCHQKEPGVHGHMVMGDADTPGCKDCHGTHNIRPASDVKSMVHRTNIPHTCSKCHSDSKIVAKHKIPAKEPLKYYLGSVHGKALNGKANTSAAVCTDCHGSHNIRPATDPKSVINRANMPQTCGACHYDVYQKYETSVHGHAVAEGIKDAPVCTDCHGEHTIQSPSQPGSTVHPTHVVATCSKCHEDKTIARRYGLPANRMSSYLGSYHGVANKFGQTTVANCASCHGAHGILPSTNPQSAVSKKNLPHTCGKCHPGAGENFAKGTVHLAPTQNKDRLIYWVKMGYTLFVTGMIGSFLLYIAMDLFHRFKRRAQSHGH